MKNHQVDTLVASETFCAIDTSRGPVDKNRPIWEKSSTLRILEMSNSPCFEAAELS